MGMGRLNPGCVCDCSVRVPLDRCRVAGRFWQPTDVTIHCQSFGGIDPQTCNEFWIPVIDPNTGSITYQLNNCGPMLPNPAALTVTIPHYDHPDFACLNGDRSKGDYYEGFVSPGMPFQCQGMWPIWTSGPCLIGFANWHVLGTPPALYYAPYIVTGSVAIDYDPAIGVGFLYAKIQVIANLYFGVEWNTPCNDQPKQGVAIGEVGTNWIASQLDVATETSPPSSRISSSYRRTFVRSFLAPPTYPAYCNHNHAYYQIMSESNYMIRTDDPVNGSKRTFELWTPDPVIDELGLTVDASVTIHTAV